MFTEAADAYIHLINIIGYNSGYEVGENDLMLVLGKLRNKDLRITQTTEKRINNWKRYLAAYDMSQDYSLADIHDKIHGKDKRTHISKESKPGCAWSDVEYAKKLILAAEKGTFPEID